MKISKPLSQEAGVILNSIHSKGEEHEHTREAQALELFHEVATTVPAYADFLKKNNIAHKKIKTFADFEKIPQTNKKDYLRKYNITELSSGGNLKMPLIYTSTSGSTGEPCYFHRTKTIDWQGSVIQELFIANGANAKQPTLAIVCFGMGVWIGGLITYEGVRMASERGYPISIITPGINKSEIFKALKQLAPHYTQTILYGYPPFIKDIIDEATLWGVDISKLNLRISTAAEAYTEEYRDFIAKKTKMRSAALDTMNIYGSADIGAMAFETPTAIAIRKALTKSPKAFHAIFGDIQRTPTLAQYFPQFITFESVEGELLITGKNSIPLIRYAIGDRGGVFSYKALVSALKKEGISMTKILREAGLTKKHDYELPFVYVYERNDLSTTLYGAQIYPETIKNVLLRAPFSEYFTGKFTLLTKYDNKHDQYIEINLELRKNVKPTKGLPAHLTDRIVSELTKKNSEYKELAKFVGVRAIPRLVFWESEDPTHFKAGIKQQWVKK